MALAQAHAAVDDDGLAGDEVAAGGEGEGHISDVFGGGGATHGGALGVAADVLLATGDPAGHDDARGEGVDADLGGEDARQGLGQGDRGGLGGGVGDGTASAGDTAERGDVDDGAAVAAQFVGGGA